MSVQVARPQFLWTGTDVRLTVKLSPPVFMEHRQLSAGMRALCRQGEFCDAKLVCAGKEFRVHKCVLAGKCDAFKNIFKDINDPHLDQLIHLSKAQLLSSTTSCLCTVGMEQ